MCNSKLGCVWAFSSVLWTILAGETLDQSEKEHWPHAKVSVTANFDAKQPSACAMTRGVERLRVKKSSGICETLCVTANFDVLQPTLMWMGPSVCTVTCGAGRPKTRVKRSSDISETFCATANFDVKRPLACTALCYSEQQHTHLLTYTNKWSCFATCNNRRVHWLHLTGRWSLCSVHPDWHGLWAWCCGGV